MLIQRYQSGNVLFFILIAVGLFAALSYAVSDGSRGGSDTISKEQARIAASEIIAYHADVRRVVEQLQQRGCSENDFGFSHPSIMRVDGSMLPSNSATMKETCRLYEAVGGGLTPKTFSNYSIPITEVTNVGSALPGVSRIMIGRFKEIGSDANAELFLTTVSLSEDVCKAINKQLKVNNGEIIPTTAGATVNVSYNGVFQAFTDYRVGKVGEEAGVGKSTLCTSNATSNIVSGQQYQFMSIVLPR